MAILTTQPPASESTAGPIHPLLAARRSPRAFAAQPIEPRDLRAILEAARWAPSAANMQPWHFIVATSAETEAHQRLVDVLYEGNARWAKAAPVLMLVVAKQYADRSGAPTPRALYDAGLAVGMLTVQAGALGIAVHQMGGFDGEKARQTLAIPDGYEPIVAVALGYPGDPETLPADLRERELAPRTRKPLSDFVFDGQWGQESSLLSA